MWAQSQRWGRTGACLGARGVCGPDAVTHGHVTTAACQGEKGWSVLPGRPGGATHQGRGLHDTGLSPCFDPDRLPASRPFGAPMWGPTASISIR